MISVRTAHVDDADALAAAHIEGWRVGYRGLFPDQYLDAEVFASERLDRWRAWTWNEFADSSLFVPVLDGRVVGFAHVGPERDEPVCDQSGTPQAHDERAHERAHERADERADGLADGLVGAGDARRGEVYGFYLHPDAWGSGCGSALMERAETHLADGGFSTAILWVLRDNPRARRFYERQGWEPTGRSTMWGGPQTATAPPVQVAEVEYRVTLGG